MGQLVRRFEPLVRAIARRRDHHSGSGDDLVQETMLRLWRSAHRFDPDRGTEPAFVAAVARNAAIDMARHRATRPVTPTADIASLVPPGASPTEHVADAMAVRSALKHLTPGQRELVRLAYFEHLTQQESRPAWACRSERSRAGPSKRSASSAGPWAASVPVLAGE